MAIIGISGKKQSGKDTVAKIIQYLIAKNKFPKLEFTSENFYEVMRGIGTEIAENLIKKKQFAYKLKQIIALLIGCTMEDLEDGSFKERPLGKEWDKWKVTRLSITMFTSPFIIYYSNEIEARVKLKEFGIFGTIEKVTMTPRLLLQLMGTECGREIIHPNIWVNSLMNEYKPIGGYYTEDSKIGVQYTDATGKILQSELEDAPQFDVDKRVWPYWVIPDVHFINEAKAIKERGGILIRVNRGNTSTDNHISETELDNYPDFDVTIDNRGSIDELIVSVKNILQKLKIL